MADKPTVKYEVRAQRDPVNNVTIYVPAIVDRNAAKSLSSKGSDPSVYILPV